MLAWLKRWWPALIVAAAVVLQFGAPLVGRVWFFEDIAAYFAPLYTSAAAAMRNGAFPTWDLGAWSGQPLVGDPQLGLFYPPNWLWMVVHPTRTYAWLQLFHVVVGAVGMWTLARARGRTAAAAAVAALGLAAGAFLVLELRHAMFVATTAWLPWVLWGIERLAARRTIDHALFVALTAALALLAGGWSMLVWGALVVAVYAGAAIARVDGRGADVDDGRGEDVDVSDDARRRRRRARLVLAAALGGAALFAALLAMVQIAPAVAHARLSPRALGTTPAFASSYAWPSWRYAATLLLPTLYGDVARGTYVGAPDQWELCGYGIGLVGGLLALASLGLRERRGERLALFAVTVVACVIARGAAQPLLGKLPLFSSLRCPARVLYVWTLAAPLLAADGLDALADGLAGRADGLATRTDGLAARAASLRSFGAWLRPLAAWLRPLALTAMALELLVTFRGDNPTTTLRAADAHPAAVEWLRLHSQPGRATNDVHLGNAFHNMGLRWRFESAGGYHSLPIWRYLHLLWIANHGAPYPHAQLADDLTGQGLWRFSSTIVDLLGVQWVVAPHDRPIDARGWTRRFAGDDGVDLWENHRIFPRAFVVYAAEHAADDAAAARAVASPAWNPARSAIVEEDVGLPPPGVGAAVAPTQATQLVREGPTTLVLEVPASRPGLVVVG
ncbi:MAG TPA: hypothetical protein VF997_11630, partial [Polyangia bacterium]